MKRTLGKLSITLEARKQKPGRANKGKSRRKVGLKGSRKKTTRGYEKMPLGLCYVSGNRTLGLREPRRKPTIPCATHDIGSCRASTKKGLRELLQLCPVYKLQSSAHKHMTHKSRRNNGGSLIIHHSTGQFRDVACPVLHQALRFLLDHGQSRDHSPSARLCGTR